MAKQTYIIDTETNGLTGYTKLHNVVFRSVDTNEVTTFRNVHTDAANCRTFIEANVSHWVGHNFLGFDRGVIKHFLDVDIRPEDITDTLVLSRMLNYNQKGGHSLEEWGSYFKLPKSTHSDFSEWSQALEDRCIKDTEINLRLYKHFQKYITSPRYIDAVALEHLTTALCISIGNNGFTFDLPKAISLRDTLSMSVNNLLNNLRKGFPKVSKVLKEVNPKLTKKGTLNSKDFRFVSDGDLTPYSADAPFSVFEWVEFNPNSPRQRVERLNAAGWKPFNKTKGHIQALRDKDTPKEKLAEYQKYGWTCDEENLSTLPNYENMEEWHEKCLIKIEPNEELMNEITTNGTKTKNEKKEEITTTPINAITKVNSLSVITELISKSMSECIKLKTDVARFVNDQLNLWSIIVTKQGVYVDCSASFVTDTWVGMRETQEPLGIIYRNKGARSLKEVILKTSRLGDLNEWISACTGLSVDPRGYPRVHPTLTNPGAWTMRVSHQNPNMANIPATLDRRGRPAFLGNECRSLWTVPEGYKLVGVDADSIQLRIFAHLCEDERLIAAISRGSKTDKTDIHHLNLAVMHPICKTREVAKTYIYALLLGAGLGKQAEILGCTKHEASVALKRMLEYYPGWKKLINGRLAKEGQSGYIECLDGRYLLIPEPRQALAAHLQSGEKIIMAKAAQNWINRLKEESVTDYKLVNWVHDEYCTEVLDYETMPEYVGEVQIDGIIEAGKQLKMVIPLGGNMKLGTTWAETH